MAVTWMRPDALSGAIASDTAFSPVEVRQLRGYRHHRGVHCASAALRNVYTHHTGEPMTEALSFGLGAGLGFTYIRDPQSGLFLIGGRGSYLERHFCNVLGVRLEVYHSEDPESAWTYTRRLIDRGRLVMLDVDMFHLPYMVQFLDLNQRFHFGGHKVLVTGYHSRTETALLSDYAWSEAQPVPVADLKRARGSAECTYPPRNAAFTFEFPERLPALRPAIRSGIQSVVLQMRFPYMDRFGGLASVSRFCRQAVRWGRLFAGEELQLLTALAGLMMEKAGTGGGNFRLLYARFLGEAAEILDQPKLVSIANHYRALGARWKEAAALLQLSVQDPTSGMYAALPGPQLLLDEIASLEHAGIGMLEDFLK
jgi:Butirosin biosynthesis protein H, N-terminal/Domain of unknown function (DUF4872)